MSDEEKDHPDTHKPTMDEPQEEFIGDEARPSVTEKELREVSEEK